MGKNTRALKSSCELSFPTTASSDGELPKDDEIIDISNAVYVLGKVIEDNEILEVNRPKEEKTKLTKFALERFKKETLPPGFVSVMFNERISSSPGFEHTNISSVMSINEPETSILVLIDYPRAPKTNLAIENSH